MVPVAWMMAALLMGGVAVTLDLLRRALRASLQQDIYIQEARALGSSTPEDTGMGHKEGHNEGHNEGAQ